MSRPLRTGVAALLACILGVSLSACNALAPIRDADGRITHRMVLSATDLMVGDCFSFVSGANHSQAEVAPCEEPHELKVIGHGRLSQARVDLAGGLQQAVSAACKEEFFAFKSASTGPRPDLQFIVSSAERNGTTVTTYSCVATDTLAAAG